MKYTDAGQDLGHPRQSVIALLVYCNLSSSHEKNTRVELSICTMYVHHLKPIQYELKVEKISLYDAVHIW